MDSFCHIFPARFINEFVKAQLPRLLRLVDVMFPPATSYYADPEQRIKYMDHYGIDIEILSISLPGHGLDRVPEKELFRLTQLANDSLAEIAEKSGGRLVATCWLPNLEGDYVDEFTRCISDLGMKGCMIYSNIFGKPIDSPPYIEFYRKASTLGYPILLHPIGWSYYPWISENRIGEAIGWPFDTSIAMCRLVFGGVLEKFPTLKIITHHLGGMIPYFIDRIRLFYEGVFSDKEVYGDAAAYYTVKLNKNPVEYFKMFYADTVIGGNVAAMKCALEFFGTDHVVFATDYPFGPGKGTVFTESSLKAVNSLDISPEEKSKILFRNSVNLFKLKV